MNPGLWSFTPNDFFLETIIGHQQYNYFHSSTPLPTPPFFSLSKSSKNKQGINGRADYG